VELPLLAVDGHGLLFNLALVVDIPLSLDDVFLTEVEWEPVSEFLVGERESNLLLDEGPHGEQIESRSDVSDLPCPWQSLD
jgi:hypothetical protein